MPKELPADPSAPEYAPIEDIDAAAEARGIAAWDDLSDEQKTAAGAAMMLDLETLDYIGDRASDDQELEWPRTDAVDASGVEYSDDMWPWRLVQAYIEGTIANGVKIAADETVDPLAAPAQPAGNVKRKKVSSIELEYFAPTVDATDVTTIERFSPIVQNLLRPLIRDVDAAEWGQSVAVRAS